MNPIINQVFAGTLLILHGFGCAMVLRLYVHKDTKELCVDIKADTGEALHLSLRYMERLLS